MAQTLPLHHQKVPTTSWSTSSALKPSSSVNVVSASQAAAVAAPHTLNINVEPSGQIYFDSAATSSIGGSANVVDQQNLVASSQNRYHSTPQSTLGDRQRIGRDKSLPKTPGVEPSSPPAATPSSSGKTALADESLLTNRSSFHSSGGLRSPDETDLKWTQFNDDSEAEETPGSRRHSESERRNLLADELLSDADDSHTSSFDPNEEMTDDKSFEMSAELKSYYLDKFKTLLYASTGVHTTDVRQAALKGTDHPVQEFFHKSQLSKSDLSKIWYLSDVNMDGHLNLDEFMVAMHLIVRRVKGNYDIPEQLPVEFRPPVTPPRMVTPQPQINPTDRAASSDDCPSGRTAARWAEFVESPQHARIPSASGSSGDNASNEPLSTPTLAKFTSIPPTDHNSTMAHPKARKGSPDSARQQKSLASVSKSPFGSASAAPFVNVAVAAAAGPLPPVPRPRPSTSSDTKTKSPPPPAASSAKIVLSPQTPNPPKGPPPKPPPRPLPQRHTRSVSLDLNKNRLAELGSSPPTAAAAGITMLPVAVPTLESADRSQPPKRDAQVQTLQNETANASVVPMLDLSFDNVGGRAPDNLRHGSNDASVNAVDIANTAESALDWNKRCVRLARVNDSLERELQKLTEIRFGLEEELKRMQKF